MFKFEAWAPENISVELRIDDAKSKGFDSRFNFSFKLTKGRNLVQIPIEQIRKVIDPKHIVLVMLFMSNPPEGSTIYYDNFRLGPMERDEVLFMPYADRMDLQPTTQGPHAALSLRAEPQPRSLEGLRHQRRVAGAERHPS